MILSIRMFHIFQGYFSVVRVRRFIFIFYILLKSIRMQSENTQQEQRPPISIFALMTLTNILINLDHGILPACTKEMQEHYSMNDLELGFLGSIVYLGIVVFGTLAGALYQRLHSKYLTVAALLFLEGTLVIFVLSDLKWMALVFRFLTGGCQVFLLVYYPVWIDKFGCHLKTLWLTLLQICVPVGIFAGYGITAGVIALGYEYQYSFYIQIVLAFLFIVAFSFIPSSKLDSRRHEEDDLVDSIMHNVPQIKQTMLDSQIVGPHPEEVILEDQHRKKKKKYNYFKMMKKLLKSPMYLVGTLTMAIILFVSTGVQFWLTDYFVNVMGFDRAMVNIAYAVVSITGPTSGCGFGGWVINRKGGYQHPKTVYYVFLFACLGIGAAVVIPFVNLFIPCAVLLWIVLFFGGAMMPGLTGIMMVSVPPYLRSFGNSNGEIIKNIFGYLPAPFMYGWFNQMFNDRAGLKLIMFWGLWAPILLAFGSFHTYKKLKSSKLQDSLLEGKDDEDIYDSEESNSPIKIKARGINSIQTEERMEKFLEEEKGKEEISDENIAQNKKKENHEAGENNEKNENNENNESNENNKSNENDQKNENKNRESDYF